MHDPHTQAFEIFGPRGLYYHWLRDRWYDKKQPKGMCPRYVSPLVVIWHYDPETDGSDDSCGWSSPKLSESDKELIKEAVEWDLKFPFFTSNSVRQSGVVVNSEYQFHSLPIGDCFAFVAAAWQWIAGHRDGRRGGANLTASEISAIISLATDPNDNLRSSLVSREEAPEEQMRHFFRCVMRAYLLHHRKWYQHPRWHVWHWSVQVSFLLALKRWLWSRCCICGGGFRFGESPVTNQWDGDGPRWFRGEPGVFHGQCDRGKMPAETVQS